jgi:hypothetical protein
MKGRLTMAEMMTRSLVCAAALAAALTNAAPLSPAFTYQGVLAEGGSPASGRYDLLFRLFDAASGGAELGVVTKDDMLVREGRLTAELDFGDLFDGDALWLQVEVRPGASSGAYTVLSPRQPMTTAPYALFATDAGHAATADSAVTADDGDTLDGHHGAFYRSWSNLTGRPPGFDDGDDDVLGSLACAAGEVATWSGAAWICDADQGADHSRTAVVSATGDPLANGTALLAAVAGIPTPTSQEEAWRVLLEPGVYDLGTSTLTVKPWMLLEGSGQETTLVTSAVCDGNTVSGAADAEIRDLSVENVCSSPTAFARAISFGSTSTRRGRLTRVTARIPGPIRRGFAVFMLGDAAVLERVTAKASGSGEVSIAINVYGDGSLVLDCTASATGDGGNYGLTASGGTWITRGSFFAEESASSWICAALRLEDASMAVTDVVARCDDYAVYVQSFTSDAMTVTLSRLDVRGPLVAEANSEGAVNVLIEHSRIETVKAAEYDDGQVAVGIAATQLASGAVLPGTGTVVCAGVWDPSWLFHPNTCP